MVARAGFHDVVCGDYVGFDEGSSIVFEEPRWILMNKLEQFNELRARSFWINKASAVMVKLTHKAPHCLVARSYTRDIMKKFYYTAHRLLKTTAFFSCFYAVYLSLLKQAAISFA